MLDLYGIGNAIVDTDVEVDDGFLADADAAKGQMTLVDSAKMSNPVSYTHLTLPTILLV